MPIFRSLSSFATVVDADLHQATDTGLVDRLERVGRNDVVFGVVTDEALVVVSADTQPRLSQVVGTEAEELSGFGDLAGCQSSSWNFDHRAGHEVDLTPCSSKTAVAAVSLDDCRLVVDFCLEAGQRNHDFRSDFDAFLLQLHKRLRGSLEPAWL